MNPWELGRHWAGLLGERDVVVAGEPGAGAALLSSIVFELGFDYLDPYTTAPDEGSSGAAVEERLSYYRERLAATAGKSKPSNEGQQRRFVKTHFGPEIFPCDRLDGVVLLVRDPRDTVYSSYKWFSGFGGSWLRGSSEQVAELTFTEFLDRVRTGDGERSIPGWARFHTQWLEAAPSIKRFTVIRFEDLKSNPVGSITALCAALGLHVSADAVVRAAEHSSFDAMRAREEEASDSEDGATKGARIMRRGMVGEWQEWYGQAGIAERFSDPALIETAARFGYLVRDAP